MLVGLIVALNLPPVAPVYRTVNHVGDQFFSSFVLAGLVALVALLTIPAAAAPAVAGALSDGRSRAVAEERERDEALPPESDDLDEMGLATG